MAERHHGEEQRGADPGVEAAEAPLGQEADVGGRPVRLLQRRVRDLQPMRGDGYGRQGNVSWEREKRGLPRLSLVPGRSLTILVGSTRNGCARAMRKTLPKMPNEWKYSPRFYRCRCRCRCRCYLETAYTGAGRSVMKQDGGMVEVCQCVSIGYAMSMRRGVHVHACVGYGTSWEGSDGSK